MRSRRRRRQTSQSSRRQSSRLRRSFKRRLLRRQSRRCVRRRRFSIRFRLLLHRHHRHHRQCLLRALRRAVRPAAGSAMRTIRAAPSARNVRVRRVSGLKSDLMAVSRAARSHLLPVIPTLMRRPADSCRAGRGSSPLLQPGAGLCPTPTMVALRGDCLNNCNGKAGAAAAFPFY